MVAVFEGLPEIGAGLYRELGTVWHVEQHLGFALPAAVLDVVRAAPPGVRETIPDMRCCPALEMPTNATLTMPTGSSASGTRHRHAVGYIGKVSRSWPRRSRATR
jgi:hypothetical protein